MLYQHPEYEASIAAERYRYIRESFCSAPRMQSPRWLKLGARTLGLSFVRMGRVLLRYGIERSSMSDFPAVRSNI